MIPASPNPAFWRGRRVFLTGHSGFKGAWLCLLLHRLGARVHGYALPAAPGEVTPFSVLGADRCGVVSTWGDVRDPAPLNRALAAAAPEIVIHFAAQSLVRRGYAAPVETFSTNVTGTATLLDAVRARSGVAAVVVATSDKVYANDDQGRPFREGDPLGGHDPYSASKAAQEMVVGAWRDGFFAAGPPIATVRAGNVIGGGDLAADRILPDAFRALERGVSLPLRNPAARRPWQFVLDPLAGYLATAEALAMGEAVPPAINFGPPKEDCWTVGEVIARLATRLPALRWEAAGEPGPREAHLLSIDAGLARERLNWQPRLRVGTAVDWCADWWQGRADGQAAALAQIDSFLAMETA